MNPVPPICEGEPTTGSCRITGNTETTPARQVTSDIADNALATPQ
jgi:hypothetical protein